MKKAGFGTAGLVLTTLTVIVVNVLILGAVARAESGRSPFTAVPLHDGKNAGVLAAGQARWYKVVQSSSDGVFQRQMDLTLVFAPDNGFRTRHVKLRVFPADQKTGWHWRDVDQVQSIGAGGVVSRDGNPVTGELLWSGWILRNDTYYVQVLNGTEASINYWLFTGNVIDAELGESAALPALADGPVGADPTRPLALLPGLQRGQLSAQQETWYVVVYNDCDGEADEEHTFTFIFTPDDGHRAHRVGFEIIPFEQLYVWQQDATGQLRGGGAGSVVSRDADPGTGELVWSGTLVDGQTYYIRLRNEAEVVIDYWLFTDEVNCLE